MGHFEWFARDDRTGIVNAARGHNVHRPAMNAEGSRCDGIEILDALRRILDVARVQFEVTVERPGNRDQHYFALTGRIGR